MARKAVSYARISAKKGEGRDVSIATQQKHVADYCQAHKLELVAAHVDEGKSGGKMANRPGLLRSLTDVHEHNAALVVYDWSRVSRDEVDALNIRRKVDVRSVAERDEDTPDGDFMFTVRAGFNAYHRKQTGQKTKDALRKLRESGRVYSRVIPFGYKAVAGRLVADKRNMPILREMMERRDGEETLQSIADDLNGRKIKTAAGGAWSCATVLRVIRRGAPE